eukprot:scaffold6665_cov78-Skeletonema_dohrnii-CCMP3373.AAC.2
MRLSTSELTKEEEKKEMAKLRKETKKLIQEIWIAFMDEKNWTWEDAQRETRLKKKPKGVIKLSAKHLCPALDRYTTEEFKYAMELKPFPKQHIPKNRPSFPTSTMNNVSDSGPHQHATENCNVRLPHSDEVMEGFIHPEQNGLAGSKRWMQNARTLFATFEEVREYGRSILASADNSPPTWCGLGGLNNDTLGNIIGFLQLEDWKQTMSLVCTGWRRAVLRNADVSQIGDLLSLALLRRPELSPCVKDPQWAPVFDLAAEVIENTNSPTVPLVAECAPKYHRFLQCMECKRKIAHPPPQPGGARQKSMHVCCSDSDSERGVNEILKIADYVSKSGSLNHNGRMLLLNKTIDIDELICLSSIPTDYKNGRYFKTDATSQIDGILSDFFEKIICQEKSSKTCASTGVVEFADCICCIRGSLQDWYNWNRTIREQSIDSGQSGASSYSNDLYIREAVFVAMKFNDRRPSRAAEGFLIAAGSLLGVAVNKKLEHPGNSIPETTMVYFAGLRTDSLWEHCLVHSRLHHDFGRRVLLSDDDEGVEPSSSSNEQQSVPALSDDERREFQRRLEEEEQRRREAESRLAEEEQRRREAEGRLAEKQRLLEEEQQRRREAESRLAEQQRAMEHKSEAQQRAMADFLANVQTLQASS